MAFNIETGSAVAPGCQACGRRDETVRLVSYPYVVSLLVVTYRRAFAGVWCAKHRRQKHLWAILITALIGWVGIPFGLLMAPAALVQLARGGSKPKEQNAGLLKSIADEKMRLGDVDGARRAYAASLRFTANPEIQDTLRRLYSADPPREERGPVVVLAWTAGLLGFAYGLGLLVGLLGYGLLSGVSYFMGDELNYIEVLIYWLPRIFFSVLGIFVLQWAYEKVLDRLNVTRDALAGSLGIVTALLFSYAVMAGEIVCDLLLYAVLQPDYLPAANLLSDLLVSALRGGVLGIANMLAYPGLISTIYIILSGVMAAYAVFALTTAGAQSTAWRTRLAALLPAHTARDLPGAQPAWLAIAVVPVLLAGLSFAIPQQSLVDDLEAIYHMNNVLDFSESSDVVQMEQELKEAARLNPRLSLAHDFLAGIMMEQGRLDEAQREVDAALAANPQDWYAYLYQGRLLMNRGDDEGAQAAFEKAVQGDPRLSAAHDGLGWIAYRKGETEQARSHFDQALSIDPFDVESRAGLGLILFYESKLDEAIPHLEAVVEAGWQDAEIYTSLVWAYQLSGQHEAAIARSTALVHSQPDSSLAHAVLAMAYQYADQPEKAAAEMEKSLSAAQDDGEIGANMRVSMLIQMRRADQAIRQGEAALATVQDPAYMYSLLSYAYSMAGRFDDAASACDQAAAAGLPEHTSLQDRARVAQFRGDLAAAEEWVVTSLELDPENAAALESLAFIRYLRGDYAGAMEALNQGMATLNNSANLLSTRALVQVEQGSLPEAIAGAQESIRLNPSSDLAYYALGMAYLKSGDEAQARPALEKFLALYWDRPYARALKAAAEEALK